MSIFTYLTRDGMFWQAVNVHHVLCAIALAGVVSQLFRLGELTVPACVNTLAVKYGLSSASFVVNVIHIGEGTRGGGTVSPLF